jgi:hypothetical protein
MGEGALKDSTKSLNQHYAEKKFKQVNGNTPAKVVPFLTENFGFLSVGHS